MSKKAPWDKGKMDFGIQGVQTGSKWGPKGVKMVNIYKAKTGPFWGQKGVILGPKTPDYKAKMKKMTN